MNEYKKLRTLILLMFGVSIFGFITTMGHLVHYTPEREPVKMEQTPDAPEGVLFEGRHIRFVISRVRESDGERAPLYLARSRMQADAMLRKLPDWGFRVVSVTQSDIDFLNKTKPEFHYIPCEL